MSPGPGTRVTWIWWNQLQQLRRRYCIHTVFWVFIYCDLNLWPSDPKNQIWTSTNRNTPATKIGWNPLHWFLRWCSQGFLGCIDSLMDRNTQKRNASINEGFWRQRHRSFQVHIAKQMKQDCRQPTVSMPSRTSNGMFVRPPRFHSSSDTVPSAS